MTQAARSTRCILLQVEMTETGELRPMKAPCGHAFSHKGITGLFAKKPRGHVLACPQAGCSRSFTLSQLVDDKDLARAIKKAARHDGALD